MGLSILHPSIFSILGIPGVGGGAILAWTPPTPLNVGAGVRSLHGGQDQPEFWMAARCWWR